MAGTVTGQDEDAEDHVICVSGLGFQDAHEKSEAVVRTLKTDELPQVTQQGVLATQA